MADQGFFEWQADSGEETIILPLYRSLDCYYQNMCAYYVESSYIAQTLGEVIFSHSLGFQQSVFARNVPFEKHPWLVMKHLAFYPPQKFSYLTFILQ